MEPVEDYFTTGLTPLLSQQARFASPIVASLPGPCPIFKLNATTSSISFALKTFHPFPRLPIELRLTIWEYATPTGRTVELEVEGEDQDIFCPKNSSVPSILHVNHESRFIALKSIKPFFHNAAMADRYIFLDLATDFLKLSLEDTHRLCLTKDVAAAAVRNLVRHVQLPCHIDATDAAMANAIACLTVRGPNRSWPAIQTLFLSGREGRGKAHVIKFWVKRPVNFEIGERKIGKYTKTIEKKLKGALEKYGAERELGVKITYV